MHLGCVTQDTPVFEAWGVLEDIFYTYNNSNKIVKLLQIAPQH